MANDIPTLPRTASPGDLVVIGDRLIGTVTAVWPDHVEVSAACSPSAIRPATLAELTR